MSYKTIVLYLRSSESSERLISAAAKVAERFESHLIGLYVTPPLPVYVGGTGAAPVVLDSYHHQHHNTIAEKLQHTFEEITRDRALVAEWRTVNALSSITRTISELAQTADLLVVGTDPEKTENGLSEDLVSRIMSSLHRPVLIVPLGQELNSIGSNVLIGWDGSDESCRAVFDSLPMLKRADSVNVLRINPSDKEKQHAIGSSSELVATLARHGVDASLTFSSCGIGEIGNELLRIAFESGVDTMVMGAYGHGRLRDFLMGSVTRKVLKELKVPVIMAH